MPGPTTNPTYTQIEDRLTDAVDKIARLYTACDEWMKECIALRAQVEAAKQNTAAAIRQLEALQIELAKTKGSIL